jgi:hypothetical protein
MEGVGLEIRPAAMMAIAKKALQRKTGARGLRSILESVLLDTMYELPGMDNVSEVVVDENAIVGDAQPILIIRINPRFPAATDVLAAACGLKYGSAPPSDGTNLNLKDTIDVCNPQVG